MPCFSKEWIKDAEGCEMRWGEERPSSIDGNAMPPAKVFRAFANDDVRLRVLLIPDDIVLVIVSLRATAERGTLGDDGRVVEVGEDVMEDRRDRAPADTR